MAEAYLLAPQDPGGALYGTKNPVIYAPDPDRAAGAAGVTIIYTLINPTRFLYKVAELYKGFALHVEPWRLITCAKVAARRVAKALPVGARVQVLTAEQSLKKVSRNGLTILDCPRDLPQTVIKRPFPKIAYQAIADATSALGNGPTFPVSIRDKSSLREQRIATGRGSMSHAVITPTDFKQLAFALKSEKNIHDESPELNAADVHDMELKEAPIAIDDRPGTDIGNGNRADNDWQAEGTGVTNPTEQMVTPAHLRT